MKLLNRYKIFLIMLMINLIILIFDQEKGFYAFEITKNNVIEMLMVIPPIFILLGLLDVWVQKETMMKFLGQGSGTVGVFISYMLGSLAAGPLYAAFPVAGVLLSKGAKLSNVFIFIGAWSTTKIPLLLFEATALGVQFALIRLFLNVIGIFIIAQLVEKLLSEKDKKEIYRSAEKNQIG